MDDLTGREAHAAGHPIAACPHMPTDPAGLEWRRQWIAAEADARRQAGTFGASTDDYRRAGLAPPDRALVSEHMHQMVMDIAAATSRAIAAVSDAIRDTFGPGSTFANTLKVLAEEAEKDAPVPTARHRPCPIHGPTTAGMCRACSRGQSPRGGAGARSSTARRGQARGRR